MPVTQGALSREEKNAKRKNSRAIIKQRLTNVSSGKPAGGAGDGQTGRGEGKTQDEKETSEAIDVAAIPGVHDDSIAILYSIASPETQLESTIMPSKGAGAGGGVSIQGSELPIFGGGKTAGKPRSRSRSTPPFASHCCPHRSASRAKARSPTRGAANLRHAPAGRQRRNQRGSG
jgi:hypothetical protein